MDAVKFIQNEGWEKALEIPNTDFGSYPQQPTHFVSHMNAFIHINALKAEAGESDVCLNDLKNLVESWEMTQIHGFEESKKIVANAPSDEHFYSWTLGSSGIRDKTVKIGELRKAIADVQRVGIETE